MPRLPCAWSFQDVGQDKLRTPFRSSAVSRHVTAVGLREARVSKSRWLGVSQGQAGLEPEGARCPGQESISEAEGQAQGWTPASLGRGGRWGGVQRHAVEVVSGP